MRAPTRALTGPMASEAASDFTYLRHVVAARFPVRSARTYLQRSVGQRLTVKLVDVARGERPGVVRCVEVQHLPSGERSMVVGDRRLASGEPASFFVPDHLVHVHTRIEGPAARSGILGPDDTVVLHVPVRSYLRFLPAIYRGEGPVASGTVSRAQTHALQAAQGRSEVTRVADEAVQVDPLRRFLFLFQHLMTTVTDGVDELDGLIDPARCKPELLPWLASWVGFELDASLPVHQQRELVRRAIRLYRSRGTRVGIEEMVTVLTSAPVRVRELAPPQAMVLGRARLAGGRDVAQRFVGREPDGAYLYDPGRRRPAAFFQLLLEARAAFQQRFGEQSEGVLHRIVDVVSQERPAHVTFTIGFDESA